MNQFLNDQVYANVMLLLVKNNLVMGKLVDTKFTNQVTDKNGLKISVKRPPRFVMTSGPALARDKADTAPRSDGKSAGCGATSGAGRGRTEQGGSVVARQEAAAGPAKTQAHPSRLRRPDAL